MPYVNPRHVVSPKKSISNLIPIYDGGVYENNREEKGWSVAIMYWDQRPAVGIRWNGEEGSPGNPQSRGLPTWFILPEALTLPVLKALTDQGLIGGGDIEKLSAEKAVKTFYPVHAAEPKQPPDTDLEIKVRGIVGKLIAEGVLASVELNKEGR